MATDLGTSYYSKAAGVQRNARPGYKYVQLDDGTIVERLNTTVEGLQSILYNNDLGQYNDQLGAFAKSLGVAVPDSDLFRPEDPNNYTERAEEGVSEYWDKDLELLLKELDFSRKKLKEETEKAELRNKQNETNFDRLENKSFAQTLRDAQLGFSGRGTYDSGFRHDALDNTIDLREENLNEAQLGFDRNATDIADQFRLGNENIGLNEERGKLEIERGRQEDIERRKRELAADQASKNQQLYKDQFSELLQELSA